MNSSKFAFPRDFFSIQPDRSHRVLIRPKFIAIPKAKLLPQLHIRGDETPNFPGNRPQQQVQPHQSTLGFPIKKSQSCAGLRPAKVSNLPPLRSAFNSPRNDLHLPSLRLPPTLTGPKTPRKSSVNLSIKARRESSFPIPQIASARLSAYQTCLSIGKFMAVQSLVNICLDSLAENAGYIVNLDGVPSEAILEICRRAAPAGLLNLETVLESGQSSDLSTSDIWVELCSQISEKDPQFLLSKVSIAPGGDYYRQVYIASLLWKQSETPFFPYADFVEILEQCGKFLSFGEFHKNADLWLVPVLKNLRVLRHLDISNCNIGPDGAKLMKTYITGSNWLQTLDLSRNRLQLAGGLSLSEALELNSSLVKLNLSYNLLGFAGVRSILEILNRNQGLLELDLTLNLFGGDIAQGNKLAKSALLSRRMKLTWI